MKWLGSRLLPQAASTAVVGLLLFAVFFGASLMAPQAAEAKMGNAGSCLNCHSEQNTTASVTLSVDGSTLPLTPAAAQVWNDDASLALSVGQAFEVDFIVEGVVRAGSDNVAIVFEPSSLWATNGGTLPSVANTGTGLATDLANWNTVWDGNDPNMVGWNDSGRAPGGSEPVGLGGDIYSKNWDATAWDEGAPDTMSDDGSEPDGVADRTGSDVRLTAPTSNGTYVIYFAGIGSGPTGRGYVATKLTITVTGGVDSTPPNVSSTVPTDTATGVTLNSSVTINWDENVDCATVTTGTVTIDSGGWTRTSCSGSQAIFSPDSQVNDTLYNVNVSTAVTDVAGNPLSSAYLFSYTTESAVDSTPPNVSSTVPADTATGVALNSQVTITFDEDINCSTANATTITSDSPTWTFDSCPASNQARFNTGGQANDTLYTVTVGNNGVEDLAGNPISPQYQFSYTTTAAVDSTPPTVSTTVPADSAVDVALNANVTITFDEDINCSTANATTITSDSPGWTFDSCPASNQARFTTSGQANSALYTVTVENNGVEDLAGNPISPQYQFSYTTIAAGGGLGCADCHGNPPTDATGGRNTPAGAVDGNHNIHVSGWIGATCDDCHVASGGYTAAHGDNNVEMAAAIQSGTYSKGTSFAQSSAPSMGSCNATLCHGSGNPTWAAAAQGCDDCHGDGAGKDHPTATFRTAPALGAHVTHMENTGAVIDGGVACVDCHSVPGAANTAGHFEIGTAAEVDMSAGAGALNSTAVSYTGGTLTCTVTYCHGANMPNGTTDGFDTTPAWGDSSSGCNYCHGLPPANATHSGKTYPTGCDGCHNTLDGAGAIANLSQHINGTVEVAGCTGCHGGGSNEYPPAAAYAPGTDGVGAHVKHIEATGTMMTKESIVGESGTTNFWCAECHTTTRGAGGHDAGGYPADVAFTNGIETGYNSHSAGYTPASGGSSGADDGTGGSCSVYCHGAAMPNGSNNGSNTAPLWTDTLSGCGTCHGSPPNTGGHGGGEALTECVGCHPDTVDGAGAIATAANHIDGTVQVTASCTGCHKAGGSGQVVTSSSPHVITSVGGSFNACEDCHPGGTKGAQHSKNGDANVVVIENNANAGISYPHTVDSGKQGFVLGGDSTVGTTEAEICWNCHDDENPDISEWNGGSATFDYGSVTENDLNWETTTWTSANFAYKTGPLANRPVSGNANPGSAGGGSIHATGGTPGTQSEVLDDVRCSYCHDVHDTGAAPNTASGPYLRGNWTSNPFKEDGAPRSEESHSWSEYLARGEVPRAGASLGQSGNNEYGGWQINQNNGTFSENYATHGGLCSNCHTEGDLVVSWSSHANVVSGFSVAAEKDIFDVSYRMDTGNGNAGNAWYAYPHHVTIDTSKTRRALEGVGKNEDWISGVRDSDDYGDGVGDPSNNVSRPTVSGVGTHIATVTGNSIDSGFHSFSCSKCHNPHASRLPRLMITNCLDAQVNTWDDGFDPSSWAGSGKQYTSTQLAYSPTAGNCHRYVKNGDGNAETGQATGTAQGSGWNSVTPW